MRACESVEDAENKIVTLLQDKFLHLLADFRYEYDTYQDYINTPENFGNICKSFSR